MINQVRNTLTWTLFLLLTLSGCQLPDNPSVQDAPLTPDFSHWLSSSTPPPQLQQGLSAYLALDDAFFSIASRFHLIRQAKHHLDLQYYIWADDEIGRLMLAELLRAADRGVKVRLLIDDQNGNQLDEQLAALIQHPNFEVKIFNPYKFRSFRALDYLLRPLKINHRMHNKLIIADGAIAVTGGRNISREYFDASDKFQFTDLDILFYGTAVQEANQTFLAFWNDPLSYRAQQLLPSTKSDGLAELKAKYQNEMQTGAKTQQRLHVAEQHIHQHLKQRPISWAKAHFIADHPNKIRGTATPQQLIYQQMRHRMGQPQQHLELVSAYFVPTASGTAYLTQLAQSGVHVSVLTNSLVANDVAIVHAFYQKYRQQLLQNGVRLYEFKPYIERAERTWYERISGNLLAPQDRNRSSLHAKFFDIDGMVFIGSFNFDPRSAHLNTEVGLVVESEPLQDEISRNLSHYLPQIAYELKLNAAGEIVWIEHQGTNPPIEHQQEPHTTRFQRLSNRAVAYLPIEWMM